MKFYSQVISDALKADPPAVRGMIEGDTVRRLLSVRGSGGHRIFTFDVLGDVSYRRLLSSKDQVALAPVRDGEVMKLPLKPNRAVRCPQCALEMQGSEFWPHYDLFHARRPGWLNAEHCAAMGVTYSPPPEQK